MAGLWVLLGTLAAAVVAGIVLSARNGRIRKARTTPIPTAGAAESVGAEQQAATLPEPVSAVLAPGSAVTLVQISTTFCAPCRHARAVLSSLAERTDGLEHVDIDVTDQPSVAHRLGVLRTPTTLAFTSGGGELFRVSGVPKAADLLGALEPHLLPRIERGSHSEGA
ncbi:thiol reductase thioredoxin [Prauserella marina]|uniref:Thioredoxin n=1 Tax=Prauserella marina TaxID=530584 RepID=A0A222VXF1_9PSEU|nr:thioredoxin family protein [Prauserella marina]ASR38594.1 thiol reductase thioredoxin [Prauserella marina]PWV81916.1 thioredoxin [Prauserella marina]SDD15259.1 Thioredoxin [Prauserella marina]